jgi:23S rRNA (cytosine1962-C5)-methyltransferase
MSETENIDSGSQAPVRVVAAVIGREDGKVLIARRRSGGIGGDWEFPGGKLEPGETPEKALERELKEELGIEALAGEFICTTFFQYSRRHIEFSAYYADILSGEPVPNEHDSFRWVAPGDMQAEKFSEPDRIIVRMLNVTRSANPYRSTESVILKPGRERAILNRHHWIFSGAAGSRPRFENGDILPVSSHEGELLGHASFNRKSSIFGRMLSFGTEPPLDAVRRNIHEALELRRRFFYPRVTNAFRLVNAEGDHLPGLIADLYGDVLVIQVTALGMEKMKPMLLDILEAELKPRSIYEKSDTPARREEGLTPSEGLLRGENVDRIQIQEESLPFMVDVVSSQKTGFFLDQREMRKLAREFAGGRRVLNAFGYSGSFSVYALKGGAVLADTVDTSENALALAAENLHINGLQEADSRCIATDVFEFLRRPDLDYDFIILDPPAFAKRKADVMNACRGYKDINRLAIKNVRPGGLVMTFSCSHFIDERLFQQVVFQAAAETGRHVRIIQKHRQAIDHPVNIYHPETAYLKGMLLAVD